MAPLGQPEQRGRARFDVEYENVDLERAHRLLRARGHPAGGARDRAATCSTGRSAVSPIAPATGAIVVTPPAGRRADGARRSPRRTSRRPRRARMTSGPFSNHTPLGAGAARRRARLCLRRRQRPHRVGRGRDRRHVHHLQRRRRRSAGEGSRIPFHVTSANWQESDRFLAGLMTAFGSPTRADRDGRRRRVRRRADSAPSAGRASKAASAAARCAPSTSPGATSKATS